jgi:hypothetical protein
MTDRDRATFEAFAARFAAVEAVCPDRPIVHARVRDRGRRSRSAMAVAMLLGGVVVLVAGVAAGSQLFVARPVASSPGNGSVASVASSPTATANPIPSSEPSDLVALVPLDPMTPPATLPPPCAGHVTVYDRLITSPAQDAGMSRSVIVGRVMAVGAAQWNTAGGRPPQHDHPEASNVIRLVRVEVEATIRGMPVADVITVWMLGGKIGCDTFGISGVPELAAGDRLVFFLKETAPKTGLAGAFEAWQAWAIDGDTVTTEFVPDVPLADVLDQLRADPASSDAP